MIPGAQRRRWCKRRGGGATVGFLLGQNCMTLCEKKYVCICSYRVMWHLNMRVHLCQKNRTTLYKHSYIFIWNICYVCSCVCGCMTWALNWSDGIWRATDERKMKRGVSMRSAFAYAFRIVDTWSGISGRFTVLRESGEVREWKNERMREWEIDRESERARESGLRGLLRSAVAHAFRILYKKEIVWKISGSEVYYTACSFLVILKD